MEEFIRRLTESLHKVEDPPALIYLSELKKCVESAAEGLALGGFKPLDEDFILRLHVEVGAFQSNDTYAMTEKDVEGFVKEARR